MEQSPTVFLPASCLKVKSRVDLGLVNLSAVAAVEREATSSEGREHLRPTQGSFFLTLAPWLLFQARPLLRHDQPGKTQRSEGHRFLCYSCTSLSKAKSWITWWKFLHSQRPSFCFGVFDPDSMTLASRTELCHNLLVTVKRTISTALPLKYFCQLCPTEICFSKLSEKLIGEYIFLCWLLICQIKDTVPKCSKATSQLPHWHI